MAPLSADAKIATRDAAFETNWKELGLTFDSKEACPMLKTCPTEAATFTVLYRGYAVEVSRAPSGWRAGVYPRSADLPILYRSEIRAVDQDEAVIEAMDRVDRLLRQ